MGHLRSVASGSSVVERISDCRSYPKVADFAQHQDTTNPAVRQCVDAWTNQIQEMNLRFPPCPTDLPRMGYGSEKGHNLTQLWTSWFFRRHSGPVSSPVLLCNRRAAAGLPVSRPARSFHRYSMSFQYPHAAVT